MAPGVSLPPTPPPGTGITPGNTPPAGGGDDPTVLPPVVITPPTPDPMTGTPTPTPTPNPALPPLKPPPKILVSDIEFPVGVRNILERRCSACHTYGERDPIGWGSVMDLSRMIASDIVVPGDPDKSRLWNRVAVRADMPYNGARLEPAEIQVLRAWMANLNRPAQRPRSTEQLMDLIVADQAKVRAQGNDHRYLSFAHFTDERRSPEEMQAAAEVLALTLNSLSRRATLFKPEPIDAEKTIFRFRLSQVGWDRDDWDELIRFYPYCIRSERAAHRAVYDRLQTEGVFVRADWFLATATKPPLYERLLDIPETLAELEDDLNIDIVDNLNRRNNRNVLRIGFRSSGVSAHNRMIERHNRGNGGFFWLSYDFNDDDDEADLRANPLGPAEFDEQNFNRRFEHAGGEAIWSLPNGLQAYALYAANGTRIDEAPKDIVKDPRRKAGAVQNGISCFGCHGATGMNSPRTFDEIVKYAEEHRNDFQNRELQEIRALYRPDGAMFIAADTQRYLKAMELAGGGRPEPGRIEYDAFINLVGQYEGKVGLRGGALELGLDVAATTALVQRGRNEDALPTGLADPLVLRDDFVCRLRRIVPSVGARPNFCRDSFTEDTVRDVCED